MPLLNKKAHDSTQPLLVSMDAVQRLRSLEVSERAALANVLQAVLAEPFKVCKLASTPSPTTPCHRALVAQRMRRTAWSPESQQIGSPVFAICGSHTY